MLKKIILFSGKAGVGKTTCARYLMDKYGFGIYSFATGVKATAVYMGWDGNKNMAGRKLLQQIGYAGREYDPDIWVRKLDAAIPDEKQDWYLSVDDWRFPNEYNYLKRYYDVVSVRIEAPNREMLKGTPEYNDVSEVDLDDFTSFNFYIDNTGSFDELYKQLDKIMEKIK